MIAQDELKSQLHYNAETGIFTRLVSNSNRVKIGDVAGSYSPIGYLYININGKKYLAHRLAWLYVYGYMPKVVDHVNHNTIDNSIVNLRDASPQQNTFNSRIASHNKSGFKGVSYIQSTKKWYASISFNNKTFNLGFYDFPELASKAYKEAAQKIHGEFYCEC